MTYINQNIQQLKPSATLAINQKVASMRQKGNDVYHFGFGQSPFPIHHSIVNSLRENADNNHYLPTIGHTPLREQIAQFLKDFQGIEVKSEYLYIGPGSKELLYQTILMFEGTFLIPKGSWVSYGPQIQTKNGEFTILNTSYQNNFKLEAKTLEKHCIENSRDQKLLILNSPNNPTGAVYTDAELEAIANVCRKYGIIVLSDEIYSQINFNRDHATSIYKFYPEKTIVFGGLSKVFSAGGYRLGFMALPKDLEYLHTSYRALFSETFSAVASPIQCAAIEAYKMNEDLEQYIKKSSLVLKEVSQYVYNELSGVNIECTQPEGAFYMMVGFNAFKEQLNKLKISTSEQLANHLLNEYQVALLPGSDFYFEEDELFFRLAFVDFDGKKALALFEKNTQKINDEFIKIHFSNVYLGVQQLKQFVESL